MVEEDEGVASEAAVLLAALAGRPLGTEIAARLVDSEAVVAVRRVVEVLSVIVALLATSVAVAALAVVVVARVVLAAGGIAAGSAVAVVVAVVAAVFVTAAPRGTLEVAEALVGVEAFKPP